MQFFLCHSPNLGANDSGGPCPCWVSIVCVEPGSEEAYGGRTVTVVLRTVLYCTVSLKLTPRLPR
jgi:hypothetical protein